MAEGEAAPTAQELSALAQGSAEWRAARVGRATASAVKALWKPPRPGGKVATKSTAWNLGARSLAHRLVAERLTQLPCRQFDGSTSAIRQGRESEPLARLAYEALTGVEVEVVGLIPHPRYSLYAASPDGLVDSDGMLEIKCPDSATLVAWVAKYGPESCPPDYWSQMMTQLACTGRRWVDFMGYDPRMPTGMRAHVWRFDPPEAWRESFELVLEKFQKFVEKVEEDYVKRCKPRRR